MAARLRFCKDNLNTNWQHVWFSDEKRFNLDGPDNVAYYWHDLRKEKLGRIKRQGGGASLMIWAAICSNKKTPLSFVQGTLDSHGYQQILSTFYIPAAGADDVLQQDNAPIHASSSTRQWLQVQNVKTLAWPSRSPDLNPIENLWGLMARRVYHEGKQFKTLPELRMAVQRCWRNLSEQDIQCFTQSMPTRVFQCIYQRGGHVNF
jgi:hypothetical protein